MTMQHPNKNHLQSYVAARLAEEQAKIIEKHLARCPECARQVSELESALQDPLLQKIKAAADEDSSDITISRERLPHQSSSTSSDIVPGDVLGGNLRLEEKLGRGGMGEAWKAYDITAKRFVVLKFVPSEMQHREEAMDLLRSSFQKIHALQHQHICPVYNLVDDPKHGYYIVMKYIDGITLSQYRHRLTNKKAKMTFSDIVQILWAIAKGLDYAHEHKVIHRDIKPGNIMIGRKDGVQVIDFGLAEEIQTQMSQTGDSAAMSSSGTRSYMAPEQWQGRIQDARTDQYALAVTAYELFAGYVPFSGNDVEIMKNSVLNDSPEAIASLPEHVNDALLKGLAKKREDRYDNCKEFVRALAAKPTASDLQNKEQKFPDGAVSINDLPSDQRSGETPPPVWLPVGLSSQSSKPPVIPKPKHGLPSWVLPTVSALAMLVICLFFFLGYVVTDKKAEPKAEPATETVSVQEEKTVPENDETIAKTEKTAQPEKDAQEVPQPDALPFKSGFMDIFEAAEKGTVQDVEYFVNNGADVNKKYDNGNTLLLAAAWGNPDAEVLKYLISQGADVHVKKNDGLTPLRAAKTEEKQAILRAAMAEKSGTETTKVPPSPGSFESIFEAARKGTVQDIEHFLKNKIDVNVRKNDEAGNTPLLEAAWHNKTDVLKYLVSQGADVHARNNEGMTALHNAAWFNTVDVLEYLVSQGGDIRAKSNVGHLPQDYAAAHNSAKVMEYFISLGSDINAKNYMDRTLLHEVALYNQNVETLKYLLSQGGDVHAKNKDGKTPLEIASTEEKKAILREAMEAVNKKTENHPKVVTGASGTEGETEPFETMKLRWQFNEEIEQAINLYREELEKERALAKKNGDLNLVLALEMELKHLTSDERTTITPFKSKKRSLFNAKARFQKSLESALESYQRNLELLIKELVQNERTKEAIIAQELLDHSDKPKPVSMAPNRSPRPLAPTLRLTLEIQADGKGIFLAERGKTTDPPHGNFHGIPFPLSAFPKAQAFQGKGGLGRLFFDLANADSPEVWIHSNWWHFKGTSLNPDQKVILADRNTDWPSLNFKKPGMNFPCRIVVESIESFSGNYGEIRIRTRSLTSSKSAQISCYATSSPGGSVFLTGYCLLPGQENNEKNRINILSENNQEKTNILLPKEIVNESIIEHITFMLNNENSCSYFDVIAGITGSFGLAAGNVGEKTVVEKIDDRGSAFRAGLKIGDEIVRFNGEKQTAEQIQKTLDEVQFGDPITVAVIRNEEEKVFRFHAE